MFLISLQDPLLNEYEEDHDDDDEEAPEKPQRAVCCAKKLHFTLNTAGLIPTSVFMCNMCDVSSGEESCTCQQRGNEAAPQRVSEADQRSVYKNRLHLFIYFFLFGVAFLVHGYEM